MERVVKVVGRNSLVSTIAVGEVGGQLSKMLPECRVIAIADANIHRCHTELVDRFEHIIIGQGETSKTLQTVENVYRELLGMGADRNTFILGIGGGIVTDITGFVASTYMRGLRFGFVSTTLLSQVDAAVGGKNGVNLDGYKNIVGTINQPEFVVCDPQMLATLPLREFRAGMAEIIKSAVIADSELFAILEGSSLESLRADHLLLCDVVLRAIRVKADIVQRDECETGERRKLNLGHTLAHAIEKCSSQYVHGEAVAIGTAFASRMAVEHQLLSAKEGERIEELFRRYGLPTECSIEPKRLMAAIRHDKKCDGNQINMVYPTSIGCCQISKIPVEEFM